MIDILPVFGTIDKLISLGSEFITDKDKLVEYQFKALELQRGTLQDLLAVQTVPWVDALVKILAALNMFSRPIGSFCMTAFGAWCHYKQIPMDAGIQAVFDGAFPAWGVSRHIDKSQEKKTEAVKAQAKAEVAKARMTFPSWLNSPG